MATLAKDLVKTVEPNAGPQSSFFQSEADIVIYGGQAGGGKTFALIVEPLRHVDNGGFRAGIFRRTYPQLKGQGGLWDEANSIYRSLEDIEVHMREGQELDARFPSGANIAFLHLQHEKTKFDYQGHQFCYLAFDELTHFTKTQFFYLLSRNRSTCGVKPYCRATCNPDAGSWVAEFIAWWIDQESGFPIPERSGKVRYFIHEDDTYHWADTPDELIAQFPDYTREHILSVTFIPASLDDNPALIEKDPGYRARLRAQPRIERERLEKGNWKAQAGSIIDSNWLRKYVIAGNRYQLIHHGRALEIPFERVRRFATIDTAGTSKEKAAEERGDPPSWSCCAIWDWFKHQDKIDNWDILILRFVYRSRVNWNELKAAIPEVLSNWNVPLAIIENAHYGQPLAQEIRGRPTRLVGPVIPGMDDSSRGAKLERAIASGLLTRLENHGLYIPDSKDSWVQSYIRELSAWTGLPKETADQIDVSSYAAFHVKSQSGAWGGVI